MRLGLWSLAAGVAVAIAVLVGSSEVGLRRLAQAFASLQGISPPREAAVPENGRQSPEMQQLAEDLREINIDRNRLLERLEAIERHLEQLTGSINKSAQVPAQPENEPAITASITTAAVPAPNGAGPAAESIPPQVAPAQEVAPADAPATPKVGFGVDLGSAQTIAGLRMLWSTAKSRHGALLDGLRPLITVREKARPGSMELRLVAGPLASATQAARLCATINTSGAVCQPAVFDGQRLALR
jgi:hypothetical protein